MEEVQVLKQPPQRFSTQDHEPKWLARAIFMPPIQDGFPLGELIEVVSLR